MTAAAFRTCANLLDLFGDVLALPSYGALLGQGFWAHLHHTAAASDLNRIVDHLDTAEFTARRNDSGNTTITLSGTCQGVPVLIDLYNATACGLAAVPGLEPQPEPTVTLTPDQFRGLLNPAAADQPEGAGL